ncbi:TetR/AcrR family transcriptional regulator [Salana multivorans]
MSRVGVDRPATERPGIREDPGAPETSETPETSVDGRTRRWDSHRAARRTELTLAARKAVHHGGPELSMDEIAAAIGTSKSIVYRYFSDRAGLQRAVGEAVLHDLGTALADASHGAATPEGALRAMVGVYLEMVAASPSVYLFVTNRDERGAEDASAPMRVLAHDTAELLVPVLTQVLEGAGRPAELAPVWAAGVIGFVRGAADLWLAERPGPDDAESPALLAFADAIADWLCHGTSLPAD